MIVYIKGKIISKDSEKVIIEQKISGTILNLFAEAILFPVHIINIAII